MRYRLCFIHRRRWRLRPGQCTRRALESRRSLQVRVVKPWVCRAQVAHQVLVHKELHVAADEALPAAHGAALRLRV